MTLIFRKSNTLLKRNPKPMKIQNESLKLDEQLNFMNKYNQEVRERNRIRNLKVYKSKNSTKNRMKRHRRSVVVLYIT